MRRTATAALSDLGHGDIDPAAPAASLSPAAQQLVEIARALASGCRVLVLDEPTSSLTHGDVARLFEIIARLKQQGQAIVYISHFLEEVQAVSDRFVVLRDGQVAGRGRTDETPASAIVELMVGRAVGELYPRSVRRAGETVLDLTDLDARRGDPGSSARRNRGHCRIARRGADAAAAYHLWSRARAEWQRASGLVRRPGLARRPLAAGRGDGQRGSRSRRAGARPEHRRQPHAVEARRPRPGRPGRAGAAGVGRAAPGSTACRCVAPGRASWCRRSPAAISRR